MLRFPLESSTEQRRVYEKLCACCNRRASATMHLPFPSPEPLTKNNVHNFMEKVSWCSLPAGRHCCVFMTMLHSKPIGFLIFPNFQCYELDIVAFSEAFQQQTLLCGLYVASSNTFVATKIQMLAGKNYSTMPHYDTLQTLTDTITCENELRHRVYDVIRDQHKIVCNSGPFITPHMKPLSALQKAENILMYNSDGTESFVHADPCFAAQLLFNPLRCFDPENVEFVNLDVGIEASVNVTATDQTQACIVALRQGKPTITTVSASQQRSTTSASAIKANIEKLLICIGTQDYINLLSSV